MSDDGGPAFPFHRSISVPEDHFAHASCGMSLRDWFAGQVLKALVITSYELTCEQSRSVIGEEAADVEIADDPRKPEIMVADTIMAMHAYKFADAMLAERKRSGSNDNS